MNAYELQLTSAFHGHPPGGTVLNNTLIQTRHGLLRWAVAVDWGTTCFSPDLSFLTNYVGGTMLFLLWDWTFAFIVQCSFPVLYWYVMGGKCRASLHSTACFFSEVLIVHQRPMAREDLFHIASPWVCVLEEQISFGVTVARRKLDLCLSVIYSLRWFLL